MTKIVFKDLEHSELAKEIAISQINPVLEKFPDTEKHRISITLSRENSPVQTGPDLFAAKICIDGKKYKDIVVEKKAKTLYLAMVELAEVLLEKLNRTGDKRRVVKRARERNFAKQTAYASSPRYDEEDTW